MIRKTAACASVLSSRPSASLAHAHQPLNTATPPPSSEPASGDREKLQRAALSCAAYAGVAAAQQASDDEAELYADVHFQEEWWNLQSICNEPVRPSVVDRARLHPAYKKGHRTSRNVARLTACDTPSRRALRTSTMSKRPCWDDMFPSSDPRYVSAQRDFRKIIMRSIDITVPPPEVVENYDAITNRSARTAVRRGFHVWGLFVVKKVPQGGLVKEYTGNRVQADDVNSSKNALDFYGQSSGTLISVPYDGAIIAPRGSGGDGRYINNSCSPNCELHQVHVGGGWVIAAISALVDLEANAECTMRYKWNSGKKRKPMPCFCASSNCEGHR